VRPRSRRELEQRLRAAGFPDEEVGDVLGRLERVGLVDDLAFARAMVEHQVVHRRAGRRAVSAALARRGVSPAVAAVALEDLDEDEQARADELARLRAARMKGIEPSSAFSRLVGLLQRRGYGGEVARTAARRALELDATQDE
jgi:regulatory protein